MSDQRVTDPPSSDTATDAASNGQQAQASVTPEQVKDMLEAFHGRMFADLRKAGVFGKPDKGAGQSQPQQPAANAGNPSSPDDVRKMIARERTFSRAAGAAGLSDAQMARMEKAFELEGPDDVQAWVQGYVTDLGLSRKDAAPVKPISPNALPVSNLGTQPAHAVVTDDVPLWQMSESDRAHLLKTKGPKAYSEKYRNDLKGTKVKIRNY